MKTIELLLSNIRLALQKRAGYTKNGKSYEAWKAKGYDDHPEVTVIIQSHNKSAQVAHVVRKLRARRALEIIVIDDGSSVGHTRRLARLVAEGGANEFLIRSNDLYENIMYDRTIRLANGQYIALLQDDDDFVSLAWIDEALAHFRQHPQLAILGGRGGMDVQLADHTVKNTVRRPSGPFEFVPAVNRAPMWLNAGLYKEKLKHIERRLAPFQYDDYELCLRAWLCGLQVGWYDARFHSLSAGGMRLYNNRFTTQQYQRNSRLLYDMYHDRMEEVNRLVAQANGAIARP